MEIGAVLGTGVSAQTEGSGDDGLEVSKEEFLNLLITQLQMQDPFQPMNNEDMIAQLAQLSSLEQLQSINQGLESNLEMDVVLGQLLNNTLATTLIGRNATAFTDRFHLSDDSDAALGYRLGGYASTVTAEIYDSDGLLVAHVAGLDAGEGSKTFVWDGYGDNGRRMPQGEYSFRVIAEDAEGNLIPDPKKFPSGMKLVVEGTEVYLSDVHELSEG